MAQNTYAAVGNREDLSDILTNISPTETVVTSRIGRSKATATYHEWVEDTLRAPAPNERAEGAPFAVVDPTPRSRLGNYTQIMLAGYNVTGTQEVVDKAGLTSEIKYQMTKAFKELALDLERAILLQDQRIAGTVGVGGTPRRFGGIPYFVQTNVLDNIVSTVNTPRAYTFNLLNDLMEMTYTEGGRPTLLVGSPRNKRIASTFKKDANIVVNSNQTERKLINVIDIIETDMGMVSSVANRIMPNNSVYILSPEYIKRAFLRPLHRESMPRLGDKHEQFFLMELTLEIRAEKAHGIIKDLNGVLPTAA